MRTPSSEWRESLTQDILTPSLPKVGWDHKHGDECIQHVIKAPLGYRILWLGLIFF